MNLELELELGNCLATETPRRTASTKRHAAHLHTENSEKERKKIKYQEWKQKNNETTEAEQKYIFLRAQ